MRSVEQEEAREFGHVHALIRKLRRLCAKFRRSNWLNENLNVAQNVLRNKKRMENKTNLRLIMDPTIWSSTYLMGRAMLLEPAINYVKATSDLTKIQKTRFLDDADWDLVRELSSMLVPFYTLTKLLSVDRYCTASKILVV